MKVRLTFGPYEPDKAPYQTDGLTDMGNAYASPNGYRPVGQFAGFTPTMPEAFNGATAFVNSEGNGFLMAGSDDSLYRYSGLSWTSLGSGYSTGQRWQFTQFSDVAIAVNAGETQEIDLITGAVTVVPDAPSATCVATVRDFVVYGQANGQTNMVQWSGFGNQDDNTPGVNQAGFQPMLTGGSVQGIAGGEYGVIVQRSRIVRMTYTGDADIPFQFDEISANIGAVSKGSIAQAGRMIFFLSDRGFQMCDGNEVKSIGFQRVDDTFAKLYPRQALETMWTAIDPRRNVVAWLVPGSPGLILLYDWVQDRWSNIRMNAIGLFSGFSANISLEALDILYPDGIDSIPYSLDDPRFAGGDPLFLVVDPLSEIGTLTGPNMAAYFQIPYQEFNQGRRTRIANSRPIGNCTSGLTLTLAGRLRLGDEDTSVARSTLTASGRMPTRINNYFIAPRLDCAEGAVWTYAQGLEVDASLGGGR